MFFIILLDSNALMRRIVSWLSQVEKLLNQFALPIAVGAIGLAAGHWFVIHVAELIVPGLDWRSQILDNAWLQWAIRGAVGLLLFGVGWRFR
jgi:hypothetical protein